MRLSVRVAGFAFCGMVLWSTPVVGSLSHQELPPIENETIEAYIQTVIERLMPYSEDPSRNSYVVIGGSNHQLSPYEVRFGHRQFLSCYAEDEVAAVVAEQIAASELGQRVRWTGSLVPAVINSSEVIEERERRAAAMLHEAGYNVRAMLEPCSSWPSRHLYTASWNELETFDRYKYVLPHIEHFQGRGIGPSVDQSNLFVAIDGQYLLEPRQPGMALGDVVFVHQGRAHLPIRELSIDLDDRLPRVLGWFDTGVDPYCRMRNGTGRSYWRTVSGSIRHPENDLSLPWRFIIDDQYSTYPLDEFLALRMQETPPEDLEGEYEVLNEVESRSVGGLDVQVVRFFGRFEYRSMIDPILVYLKFPGGGYGRIWFDNVLSEYPPNTTDYWSEVVSRINFGLPRPEGIYAERVVQIHEVRQGETIESLAQSMAWQRSAEEEFNRLNSTREGDEVHPGERVKLIAFEIGSPSREQIIAYSALPICGDAPVSEE